MNNSILRIQRFLNISIVLITVIVILGSLGLWIVNYETLTSFILKMVHKESWRTYFEQEVFPPSRFHLLQYLVLILSLFWAFIGYRLYTQTQYLATNFAYVGRQSKNILHRQIQQFEKQETFFFLSILLLFSLRGILQIYRYELQYDEAWTYNHFISNGFFVSAISPNNNHILYTLIACWFDYLPFEAKYCLRFPAYLGGIATCILFYGMVRSLLGQRKWALIALAWFAFSPAICFYSMYARGYIFQIFFTILTFWTSLKLSTPHHSISSNYLWGVWIIASILGFYSVPTYAYIWLVINSFLGIHFFTQSGQYKKWLISLLSVLLVTTLLYFPFLITNGFNTLIAVASTEAPQGEHFVSYQDKVADWILFGGGRGTSVYWFWLLLTCCTLSIWWKTTAQRIKRTIELVILFLLFPSLLNLLIGTQPPYRVWCFLSIAVGLSLGIIGSHYTQKLTSSVVFILIALSLSFFSIWRTEVHYAIRWSATLDQNVKTISNVLLQHNFSEVYLFSNYDKPLLEYYYLIKEKRLKVFMEAKASKNHAPFINIRLYPVVLWDKEDRVASLEEKQWLEQYYPITLYEDARVALRKPL